MAPRRKRVERGKHGGQDLPMPLDLLAKVLLSFPAKELCRLRAVCRSWRSLLSSKDFIAMHMARHYKYPFIVVSYYERLYKETGRPDDILCDIMDISGNVVKRIRSTGNGLRNDCMLSAYGDLVCIVAKANNSVRLLNPATGVEYTTPKKLAKEHAVHHQDLNFSRNILVFGHVSSTGEYKVLRVLDRMSDKEPSHQLREVFTLGSSNDRWRGAKSPSKLAIKKNVVIGSIGYFCMDSFDREKDFKPDYVASFDLETEEL